MKMIDIDGIIVHQYPEEMFENTEYYGFIYVTKDLTNDKFYVGRCQFGNTCIKWQNYFGSGREIKRALTAHGKQNFKKYIIDIAKNREEWKQKESHYITLFQAKVNNKFYNSTPGRNRQK